MKRLWREKKTQNYTNQYGGESENLKYGQNRNTRYSVATDYASNVLVRTQSNGIDDQGVTNDIGVVTSFMGQMGVGTLEQLDHTSIVTVDLSMPRQHVDIVGYEAFNLNFMTTGFINDNPSGSAKYRLTDIQFDSIALNSIKDAYDKIIGVKTRQYSTGDYPYLSIGSSIMQIPKVNDKPKYTKLGKFFAGLTGVYCFDNADVFKYSRS